MLLSKICNFNIMSSNKLDSKKVENWTLSGDRLDKERDQGSMVNLVEGSGRTERNSP